MKITKARLKELIKEELEEASVSPRVRAAAQAVLKMSVAEKAIKSAEDAFKSLEQSVPGQLRLPRDQQLKLVERPTALAGAAKKLEDAAFSMAQKFGLYAESQDLEEVKQGGEAAVATRTIATSLEKSVSNLLFTVQEILPRDVEQLSIDESTLNKMSKSLQSSRTALLVLNKELEGFISTLEEQNPGFEVPAGSDNADAGEIAKRASAGAGAPPISSRREKKRRPK